MRNIFSSLESNNQADEFHLKCTMTFISAIPNYEFSEITKNSDYLYKQLYLNSTNQHLLDFSCDSPKFSPHERLITF